MGTDVALMLGIAHTLVENGWHDEAFLARCTTGYAVFASYLLGESDGIAKKRRMGGRDLWCWRSENPRAGGYFPPKYNHADGGLGNAAPTVW